MIPPKCVRRSNCTHGGSGPHPPQVGLWTTYKHQHHSRLLRATYDVVRLLDIQHRAPLESRETCILATALLGAAARYRLQTLAIDCAPGHEKSAEMTNSHQPPSLCRLLQALPAGGPSLTHRPLAAAAPSPAAAAVSARGLPVVASSSGVATTATASATSSSSHSLSPRRRRRTAAAAAAAAASGGGSGCAVWLGCSDGGWRRSRTQRGTGHGPSFPSPLPLGPPATAAAAGVAPAAAGAVVAPAAAAAAVGPEVLGIADGLPIRCVRACVRGCMVALRVSCVNKEDAASVCVYGAGAGAMRLPACPTPLPGLPAGVAAGCRWRGRGQLLAHCLPPCLSPCLRGRFSPQLPGPASRDRFLKGGEPLGG